MAARAYLGGSSLAAVAWADALEAATAGLWPRFDIDVPVATLVPASGRWRAPGLSEEWRGVLLTIPARGRCRGASCAWRAQRRGSVGACDDRVDAVAFRVIDGVGVLTNEAADRDAVLEQTPLALRT